jgi:hypothetical protein
MLDVYQKPYDPEHAVMYLDETSKQILIETRAAVPAKPGRKARQDNEYERNGVAPLEGWRHVKVTGRHVTIDYTHVLRDFSDVPFPKR